MLSRTKAHLYILKWLVPVPVTALHTFWFDKRTFGFQKCRVACFDIWPLIMIDKCRRNDTWLFVVALALLAPTATALQTLLEVCLAYAGPHDIVYNTMKTVCMLVRPKQSQGRYSTRIRLGNEELVFVEEFRYLWHVTTADCRDHKDIKKQFRMENPVGNMLVRKFSFASIEAKIWLFISHCCPIYGCALWRHSYQNSIRKLTVSYSDKFKRLLTSPDTPARVWH